MKFKSNKKGFTLIELIVVIAVIGVLVLLAVPRVIGHLENAKLTRIRYDVKVMETYIAKDLIKSNSEFISWDNSNKDLGLSVLNKSLYETAGVAKKIDKSAVTLTFSGVGGTLEINDGYKMIPANYKPQIKTKLSGTFYSNENGKVYYTEDKPITSNNSTVVPPLYCTAPETLQYDFDSVTGTIIKYNGNSQDVTIPSSFMVNGECYPVLIIGTGAFQGKNIKSVIIPQSVVSIKDNAFKDNQITTVNIPYSVETIGEHAFSNNNIVSAIIKNNIENINIAPEAFINNGASGTDTITPVFSPITDKDLGIIFHKDTGTIISIVDFEGLDNTDVSNDGGINSNIPSTFNGGKTVVIPATIIVDGIEYPVVNIASGAYQGEGIVNLILPEGLKRIEDYAFAGNQIVNVTLPESIEYVGNYAFAFNEVEKIGNIPGNSIKPTIRNISLKNEEQINKLDIYGDILENGSKINTYEGLINTTLLDHIFVNSSANLIIDANITPTEPTNINPTAVITMTPDQELTTGTNIIWVSSNSTATNGSTITNVEWQGKQSMYTTEGNYTVKLRVQDSNGNWSDWVQKDFFVINGKDIKQIAAGARHTVALLNDGTVKTWGYNVDGELGIGNTLQKTSPVIVTGLTNVKEIIAGEEHTLALLNDGTVKSWGSNSQGTLGIGDTTSQLRPVTVLGLNNVKQIAAGYLTTFAVLTDGTVKAWGYNPSGQLGIGNNANQYTPVTIPGLTNVKQVVSGMYHTFVLLNDGTVKGWGLNTLGTLGDGTTTTKLTPRIIPELTNVKSIITGAFHTFVILNDGTIKTWGYNAYGELGIGNKIIQYSPVTVPGLTNIKQIKAGGHYTVALMNDGTVKAWGYNLYGELGIGNTTQQNSPVIVTGLTNVAQLATGNYHTLALMNDGTVKAWGWNATGQLGDGTTSTRLTPIAVTALN